MRYAVLVCLLLLSACMNDHENSRLHDITIPTVRIVDNLAQEYQAALPENHADEEMPVINEYFAGLVYDPVTRTFSGTVTLRQSGESAPAELRLLNANSFAALALLLTPDAHSSEIASYTVEITTPLGYSVTGPGSKSEEELEDAKITTFNASMIRSFYFAVSRYYMHETFVLPSGVIVHLYHYSHNLPVDDILHEVSETMAFLHDIVGAYPYTHIRIVEADMPVLSVSQVVFASTADLRNPSIFGLRRALAQQWFGGVVASAVPQDERLSAELAEFVIALADGRQQEGIFSEIFSVMGEANFIETLREYYRQFAYQLAAFEDFLAVAEEIHGRSVL